MSVREIPVAVVKPINLVAQIQNLQNHYGNNISWLSKVYGRAYNHQDGERIIPVVYHKGSDYEEVLPDENLNFCFFKLEGGKTKFILNEDNSPQYYLAELSVIFWLNTKKIYTDIDYKFEEHIEMIKSEIFRVTNTYDGHMNFLAIKSGYDQVFEGYNFGDVTQRLFKSPFHALKLTFELRFSYCEY